MIPRLVHKIEGVTEEQKKDRVGGILGGWLDTQDSCKEFGKPALGDIFKNWMCEIGPVLVCPANDDKAPLSLMTPDPFISVISAAQHVFIILTIMLIVMMTFTTMMMIDYYEWNMS